MCVVAGRRTLRVLIPALALCCSSSLSTALDAFAADNVSTADRSRAERLFKEGSEALEKGKNDEACAKLIESESIIVALGTEFNLGVCLELTHKPASAKRAFLIAATLAKQAGKDSIAKEATARAKKMEAATPRLVIHTPADAGKVEIACDGKPIPPAEVEKPLELDPGKHRIEAKSEGRAPFNATVDLMEARTTEITIAFGASSVQQTMKPTNPSADGDDGPPWKVIGLGVAGAGVVALGVSVIFGLSAKSGLDDSGCRDGRVCPDKASADRLDDAHGKADLATILAVVGGVLGVGGAVIFFTAPVKASASRDHASLSFTTSW